MKNHAIPRHGMIHPHRWPYTRYWHTNTYNLVWYHRNCAMVSNILVGHVLAWLHDLHKIMLSL